MSKQGQKISLGVRVIIVQDNKALVVCQRKHNGRNVYILPGGGIHAREDIFTAAKREVWEESCLKVKPLKLLYFKELFGPNFRSFEFYVLGKIISGRLKLGCDPELSDNSQVLKKVIFVPLNDLKNLSFYPQELRTKLAKDWRRKFKDVDVHLGIQRFTSKQFQRLFGKR